MIWQFKHQNCHSFDNIGQFRIVWREKKKIDLHKVYYYQ